MGEKIKTQHTVLVVEDEPLLRMSAVDLVLALGLEVLEAASADEAIERLEAHRNVQVIFTDIQMAGTMDGLQLAAYARDRWPPLGLIIVSGAHKPLPDHMPEGARFFSKPYDERAIAAALDELTS